ncbi:hypothetical protein ILYODFUR_010152 [Ilyodon furcidens]|uniref:Secreted protein n=1 Tax=Ilyodon furcidens TaxID=33524 RepID=A0ABV0T6U6_9TELE
MGMVVSTQKLLFFLLYFSTVDRQEMKREGKYCSKRCKGRDLNPGQPGPGLRPLYIVRALNPLHHQPIHTEVYIVCDTLSHGIDVLSMWLAQCIPVCSLKATSQGFFTFL